MKRYSSIEQMKYEIVRLLGVTLGLDISSRTNGSVGGKITNSLGIWIIIN
ncbi:small, acid-soluble spore protein, alpha/beta type [Bacillus cereus]|nr:small, acid-soluble spore protein, alpha/beta type [Bacillus cereus]